MWGAASSDTPVLDSFTASIAELIRNRDGAKLQDYLQIEPPLSQVYQQMVVELQRKYPSNDKNEEQLLKKCEGLVPSVDTGSSWTAFANFMRSYFTFIRDVNVDNLLDTYNLLKGLLKYVPTFMSLLSLLVY